ncbi:MAG: ATP-binding protein [Myxococcota bacterium]
MRRRWNAAVEFLMPKGLVGDDEEIGRYFVTAWLATAPFILLSIALYAATGVWGQVVLAALMGAVGLVMVPYFRRTGRLGPAARVSLVAAAVNFGLATLVQTPPDLFNVAFLAVVPLLASLIFGPRHALWWVAGVVVWGLAMLGLALRGYTLPFRDTTPWFSSGMNFVFMVLLTWVFARTYANLQRRALERTRAADRAKSAFLAAVSHEIRTPMNGVIGMTELLLQGDMTAEQREQLSVLQRSGHLLVALINDLLDFSKAEAGKLNIESAPFDLRALLTDVETLYAPEAKKKRLKLRLEVDEGVPTWLKGDGFRLRQVLSNLVSNALKFTEAGHVTLRAAPAGEDRVAFSVEDSGVGISAEHLPTLFTRFQQGDGARRRHLGGTGLGLALSQQLVGLMGGRIEVTSTPGEGSRFTFVLPLPRTGMPSSVAAPSSPLPVSRSRRALVVDDNAVNLAVAVGLMTRAGFVTDSTASGREAVELVSRTDYAVVLMDLQMPEMDGLEATARIRALAGRAGLVPVVGLTASALPEDLKACLGAGMNEVLAKPVTWAALQAVLKRLVLPAASLGEAVTSAA